MKTWKRIFALLGALMLIGLYASTLIFALIDSPLSSDLLILSISATIVFPVILYACILFSRLMNHEDNDTPDNDS